ncbi:hypothetical protein G9P44_003731 [Scheffersomyces stipitis]|nr:hypothetical protein G9P44_003731 [Scheffersomyces stipitis]
MFSSRILWSSGALRSSGIPLRNNVRLGLRQNIIVRNYASTIRPPQNTPRLRYLFYMFCFSSVLLYFVGKKVDKKKQPKTSFNSEREFQEYEEATGLKRRYKLINHDKNKNYKFYAIPYAFSDKTVDEIADKIKKHDNGKQVKIIDPAVLIEQEKEDESKKYCYLLQDLELSRSPYPKGLITALVKEEIQFYMNTRNGTFDTNFVLKNFPQSTDEAIKFENDVSDIQKCIILQNDFNSELDSDKSATTARSIRNVKGYFETVGRTKEIVQKGGAVDKQIKEIISDDF